MNETPWLKAEVPHSGGTASPSILFELVSPTGQASGAHKFKNRKIWVLGFFGGVVALVVFVALRMFTLGEVTMTNQKVEPAVSPLQRVVEGALAGTKGTYAVVVKNLKTGEQYARNEHLVFDSGSLYKIWVLGAAFEQLEQGALWEDEVLSEGIAELNRRFGIDNDEAELTEGEMSMSVGQAMQQMVVISHNYSAMLLVERLTQATVSAYIRNEGFNESGLEETPRTTAFDVALFFEKLYRGGLVSAESRQKMLDLFKKQALVEKLPKYLPKEAVVAHKTGEVGLFSHDAGIIFGPSGDYLVAVLSKSDSPYGAEERIALLAKAVYGYFEGVAW